MTTFSGPLKTFLERIESPALWTLQIEEPERQMLLLGLQKLRAERPGWDYACREIEIKLGGQIDWPTYPNSICFRCRQEKPGAQLVTTERGGRYCLDCIKTVEVCRGCGCTSARAAYYQKRAARNAAEDASAQSARTKYYRRNLSCGNQYAHDFIAVDPYTRAASCLIDGGGHRYPLTFPSHEDALNYFSALFGPAWREFHEIVRYDMAQQEWGGK